MEVSKHLTWMAGIGDGIPGGGGWLQASREEQKNK